MRVFVSIILLGCIMAAGGEEATREDVTAHEWGTFTAVLGSDGRELNWWLPSVEGPSALPEFVRQVLNVTTKTGAWLLRMETPVIYFYAERPVDLRVSVDDTRVRVTEAYPETVTARTFPVELPTQKSLREWQIQIRPPQDAVGAKMLEVGARGAHYRHARQVPEAWWVVGQTPAKEVEKFVFYRGAGALTMPKRVISVNKQGVEIIDGGLPAFLVEVMNGELRWKRIPASKMKAEVKSAIVSWPSEAAEGSKGADGLAHALVATLVEAGLTQSEAAAMVATWREAWMDEPGARVLEILPRQWVDEVLPLRISPRPGKVERVFVARWELLSGDRERAVIAAVDEDDEEALRGLHLGRFMNAAMERAAYIRDQEFRNFSNQLVWRLNLPPDAGNK